MKHFTYKRGFSLPELMISVGILAVIVISATTFQKDVFSLNRYLQGTLNAQLDARHLIKNMVTELRKASPSEEGSYPIALASTTGITFYSDVDNNGTQERVRYFLNGTNITKGVIVPTGSPLTYATTSEKFSTLISGFIASSTNPLFQYYPATYTGTTSPLTEPIDISAIRLIKITVIIDRDPIQSPMPLIVTSQVNLRNLKDNQ